MRSGSLLGLRDQDLVRGLGYEIEPRGRHNVLRASSGRAQAVAVFLQEDGTTKEATFKFTKKPNRCHYQRPERTSAGPSS